MSQNPAPPPGPSNAWQRATLVEDERGGGYPAVLRYGPYYFVSGSDGHRDLKSEKIDPEVAEKATAQCRNSYGRVARRLEQAGLGGDSAVWIENFTSGQHWRLERMGLWPEYFGEENHQRAVSFGSQTRMHGINMLTSVVLAIDPTVPRRVAVAPPGRGRASRITRVGPLVFVIGVRGHFDPAQPEVHVQEETDDSFDVQLDYCFKTIAAHLAKDGTPPSHLVRVDSALRAARFVPRYEAGVRRHFDGKIPFATYAVGTPLGSRLEQEIGGIAVVDGADRKVFSPLGLRFLVSAMAGSPPSAGSARARRPGPEGNSLAHPSDSNRREFSLWCMRLLPSKIAYTTIERGLAASQVGGLV